MSGWEAAYARWKATPPPLLYVAGAPEVPGGLFDSVAGLFTFEAEDSNVHATCKRLLRTDSGKICVKLTKNIVRNGDIR